MAALTAERDDLRSRLTASQKELAESKELLDTEGHELDEQTEVMSGLEAELQEVMIVFDFLHRFWAL